MALVPVVADPRISPLAAMHAAGLTFADLAKRCHYSETRIRETIRARERAIAACLAGDRRPVAKKNRTGSAVTTRICRALDAYDIFHLLPDAVRQGSGTTVRSRTLRDARPRTDGATPGTGRPDQTRRKATTRRTGTAIPGTATTRPEATGTKRKSPVLREGRPD